MSKALGKFRFLGLMATGALFMASTATAAPGYATSDLNLRAGPGPQYTRIATIPAGTIVEIDDCTSWCTAKYQGYFGWVSAKYIVFGLPDTSGSSARFRFRTPRPDLHRGGWCPGPGMGAPCIDPFWNNGQ
jgi:uncharacterized protein YraI